MNKYISTILLLILCLFSCTSHKNGNDPTPEAEISEPKDSILEFKTMHGFYCENPQITRSCLGPDAIADPTPAIENLKKYSFSIECEDCYHGYNFQLMLQYPDMPDNSYRSWTENNNYRRYYSIILTDWFHNAIDKKLKVYLPKTFEWTCDSTVSYHKGRVEKYLKPLFKKEHTKDEFQEGCRYGSFSLFVAECYRWGQYATLYICESSAVNGSYHGYYKCNYFTIPRDSGGGVPLRFNNIVKEEYSNEVLKLLAEGILEKRNGVGKQIEDYNGDYSSLKTDQVAIIQEGLVFYFNPYEIGSYAEGEIFVVLPFDKVKNMLNENLLLDL